MKKDKKYWLSLIALIVMMIISMMDIDAQNWIRQDNIHTLEQDTVVMLHYETAAICREWGSGKIEDCDAVRAQVWMFMLKNRIYTGIKFFTKETKELIEINKYKNCRVVTASVTERVNIIDFIISNNTVGDIDNYIYIRLHMENHNNR